jgi:RsiW-degrading membrane proteinase PrsW (M82 family)
MPENPYQPSLEAGPPGKPIPWFRVIFGTYVACAIVVYAYFEYRTVNTPYNNATGSTVIWSAIWGGVLLWLLLRWLLPVWNKGVPQK